MSKIYQIAGFFFFGVSLTGIISYSAYTFKELKNWGVSLGAIALGLIIISAITDDAAIAYLKINRLAYLGCVIAIAFLLIIGTVIQWQ